MSDNYIDLVEQRNWLNLLTWDGFLYVFRYLKKGAIITLLFVSREMNELANEYIRHRKIVGGNLCNYGATCGNVELVALGISCKHPTDDIVEYAILAEHFGLAQWALANDWNFDPSGFCCDLAINGHLSALKFVYEIYGDWSNTVHIMIAREGHIHVLEWARGMKLITANELLDIARKS
jgi:hypothetical protein